MKQELLGKIERVRENIAQVMIGNEEKVGLILTSLIAGGHVLLEDLPGTGKTVMAKSLAKSIQAKFSRIQFTPDLLPSDVTGINYYNQKINDFVLKKGPAFCNILLADEINRATPRTQSSLLECMEEVQISIDGETMKLERPYFVIATQNPIESSGTYPLPEAQLDRFLMKLSMNPLSPEEETRLLNRFLSEKPLDTLEPVASLEDILELQESVGEIFFHPLLIQYMVDITQASRQDNRLLSGASPRASLALSRAVRAYAIVQGRDYVIPDDIKNLAVPVLAHRLLCPKSAYDKNIQSEILSDIISQIPVPTEDWRS